MKNQKSIRVLIADSSPADVDTLMSVLAISPEIEVIGAATTGKQAIELVSKLKPDIVTISESLEGVDSLEVIKQIMAYNPTPILILTGPNCEDRKDNVLKALSMGALDIVEKPTTVTRNAPPLYPPRTRGGYRGGSELVETVKLLSRTKVVTHLAGKLEKKRRPKPIESGHRSEPKFGDHRLDKLLAIAASTGGPTALAEILRRLPAGSGIGVVIVQHVAEGFSAGLAEWLDRESEMTVREAQNGDRIKFGYAFLAPTGFHMVVTSGNRIMLNRKPPVAGHRPSADILFTSVARTYGRDSIGVILTGMGSDGAKGIVAIKNAGGKTIAQDEQSSVVFGMPKAAIETGVVDEILPLDSIVEKIVLLCKQAI